MDHDPFNSSTTGYKSQPEFVKSKNSRPELIVIYLGTLSNLMGSVSGFNAARGKESLL